MTQIFYTMGHFYLFFYKKVVNFAIEFLLLVINNKYGINKIT